MDSIKTLGLGSPISFKHLFHSRPKSRHLPVVKLERRLSLLVLKLQKFLGGKIIFLCLFSMAKKKKIVQVENLLRKHFSFNFDCFLKAN
jgi:hypothetical protein